MPFHPGLSKIPARVGGPGSDIINLGITIGDMLHFILIMMSLPGHPTRAGIFDNPGCF